MNRFQLSVITFLLAVLLTRIYLNGPLEKEPVNSLELFEKIRFSISGRIQSLLPNPQAALLSGMVLGVKEDLPQDFNESLKKTSTIHLVVVSGQNLSLVAGFIMAFSKFFGRRKTILLATLTILFYALVTGLQIPVIRASIMVLLTFIAQLFGRERDGLWILLITAFIMLIYQPNWLLSISFQLSFLATIGVVVVAPELLKRLNFLPEIIKEDFAISLSAQALTWPIIAANFHQASLIGLLVNTLILFVVPIIMVTGAIALTLSLLSLTLGSISLIIPAVFLTYFVYIVHFFGSLSWADIYIRQMPAIIWVGYYILILGIFLLLKRVNFENTT